MTPDPRLSVLAPLAGKRVLFIARADAPVVHALARHAGALETPPTLTILARAGEERGAPDGVRVIAAEPRAPQFGLDDAGFEDAFATDLVVWLPEAHPRAGQTSVGLDAALETWPTVAQNLVDALVREGPDDGGQHVPLLMLSSLDVAGARDGLLTESTIARTPYPNAGQGGKETWDVDAEIAWAARTLAAVEARAGHADVKSKLTDAAKSELQANKEPSRGRALKARVADRAQGFFDVAQEQAGLDRAQGWGFVSTTGWASALAEQVLDRALSKLAVVRMAALIDADDPAHSPLLPLVRRIEAGQRRLPWAGDTIVDVVPATTAAAGVALVAAGLLAEQAPPLVHLTAADENPLTVERLCDLLDLARRPARPSSPSSGGTRALVTAGRRALTHALRAGVDVAAPQDSTLGTLGRRAGRLLDDVERQVEKVAPKIAAPLKETATQAIEQVAGVALDDDAEHTRLPVRPQQTRVRARALGRLERTLRTQQQAPRGARLWAPGDIDWRRYLLDDAVPKLRAHARAQHAEANESAPLVPYDDLLALLDEVSDRYQARPALSRFEGDDVWDIHYRELKPRVSAIAARLRAAGVTPGERVWLSADNHPDWALVAFGTLAAGGVLVPTDPALSIEQAEHIAAKARPVVAVVDKKARTTYGAALEARADTRVLDLHLTAQAGTADDARTFTRADWHRPAPDDVASILFTSGTTGDPKGVMLSHQNFTSLIASLGTVFDMHGDDRALSVLPLHHTLEFSCGLLLPLAAGAQVFYVDALTGERVLHALKAGRITGMVGVPALWQLLERRIRGQAKERGDRLGDLFERAVSLSRSVGAATGVDVGRLLFKSVHDELGGHLKTLISGGAALPSDTHQLFAGLGLHLAEGYGLTETAPVLTVAEGAPGAPSGTVGEAIPGVTVKVHAPDDQGVGEVWAKGPNVMRGYFENDDATRAVLTDDGWFKTGDLGRFDDNGRLVLVGRAKDVVVTASGENVYLDDVEDRIGAVVGIEELALVGLPDPRGGERLALAFVVAEGNTVDAADKALGETLKKLPVTFRPTVVERVEGPLPRTATRKVKRRVVAETLGARLAQKSADAVEPTATVVSGPVRAAVALVAGVDDGNIVATTELLGDLGFDSLMWVELQGALEPLFSGVDAESLFGCTTVADLERYVLSLKDGGAPSKVRADVADADDAKPVRLPSIFVGPARSTIGRLQRDTYARLFETDVEGRAHIPQNTPCIVVANHSSHLDTGLVKFALGRYGQKLSPLAAKDYFFEGHPLKVAFFEQLTNLVPLDRESGSGAAFEQAVSVVEQGNVVLIYPEGTRRREGDIGAFKPLVGRLALKTGRPVLPVYLRGPVDVLPKGAVMPRGRQLGARIGPPLFADDLARLTRGEAPVAAARKATELVRAAVLALSEGRELDLARIDAGAADTLFDARAQQG